MPQAEELADLFTFAGKFGGKGSPDVESPVGFHQGLVTAWDSRTGENSVHVLGTTVNDLPVLTTADAILLNEGDTVGILRFRQTYFILGRIAPPGAGAALSIRQGYDGGVLSVSSSSYVDLGGPEVTDVYVGSSRRVIVFVSAQIVAGNCYGHAATEVSGASSIPPGGTGGATAVVGAFDQSDTTSTGDILAGVTATAVQVFDENDGLNAGLNTFSMRYRRERASGFTPINDALIGRRRLVVFPF